MGQIAVAIDSEKEMTVFVIDGEISFSAITRKIEEYYRGGNVTKNVIWDARKTQLGKLDPERIRGVMPMIRTGALARSGGKTAIVVSNDASYGIARMCSIIAEVKQFPVKIEAFRSLEEAEAWIHERGAGARGESG